MERFTPAICTTATHGCTCFPLDPLLSPGPWRRHIGAAALCYALFILIVNAGDRTTRPTELPCFVRFLPIEKGVFNKTAKCREKDGRIWVPLWENISDIPRRDTDQTYGVDTVGLF